MAKVFNINKVIAASTYNGQVTAHNKVYKYCVINGTLRIYLGGNLLAAIRNVQAGRYAATALRWLNNTGV